MDIAGITAFVTTGQERSFTVAARKLGITQSAVSKAISRLEDELGVRLVNRSTRAVQLTPEGAAFQERCQRILFELGEAQRELSDTGPLRGLVRLSASPGISRLLAVPLAGLSAEHPQLQFDLSMSASPFDLVDSQIDFAISAQDIPDRRLVARSLGRPKRITVAAPAYLDAHPAPLTIQDLDHHPCLGAVVPDTGLVRSWVFDMSGVQHIHHINPVMRSDSLDAIIDAAIAGMGIIQMPSYMVGDSIGSGRLRPVLEDHIAPGYEYWIVYQKTKTPSSRKTRVVLDTLSRYFALPWFTDIGW